MMKTLIIGAKSNLSMMLQNVLQDSVLISSAEVCLNAIVLKPYVGQHVNIIFNNFQTANKLGDVTHPQSYIEYAIYSTSKVLEFIKEHRLHVNKIIYTSSSSVYGNNILCKESDELKPTSLHAALKVANEKLVEQFCLDNNIDYTIARIFNMYGGNDHFSVISKLLKAYKEGTAFQLVNHGSAIRDFIHIDDVVRIYDKIARTPLLPFLNIGTGEGVSIKNIIDFLKLHHYEISVESSHKSEIKMSTADNTLLCERVGFDSFCRVEEYLLKAIQA